KLPWDDVSEMIPAFAVMLFMPLTYSIANGIAMGFIFYPIVKALSGKFRDVHWLTWILCALFLFRFFFLEI
ncbi:MAG: NCS2 family permease, partial [Calditrichota bacterium]